jgi:hypothetical protein
VHQPSSHWAWGTERSDNVPRVRPRIGCLVAVLIVLGALAPSAVGAPRFRPSVRGGMGLVPPAGSPDIAIGENDPVVYHGGSVMRPPVTIHTVFWAPNGYAFSGSPAGGITGYEAMVKQFLVDAAHDSGSSGNVFSVLSQYPDLTGPGGYQFAYDPTTDSVDDLYPYPRPTKQCASAAGTAACITDSAVSAELDRVISARDPSGRGLHDLWLMVLPPNVDECISAGVCGTSTFAGYHSVANLGHGEVIYAVIIDPLIEASPIAGSDPQGNPDAEVTLDTIAHEVVEAITDPDGVGWMDPNGFEVADKCEAGPQIATPLGFAPNGAPYDQVIGGREYLIQTMWSNPASGCVQSSNVITTSPGLPSVSLRQFSGQVSGRSGVAIGGVPVRVLLVRDKTVVAHALATTHNTGAWGPVRLRSVSRASSHAFGDDRDQILIVYGVGGPPPEQIDTGNGGDPFAEAGWTGWFDLDNGYRVTPNAITVAPCGQTGVLGLNVGGRATAPPISFCDTETGVATVATGRSSAGTALTMSSQDNRAVSAPAPNGALVKLTVALGEPGSVSALGNADVFLDPSGFPACLADLRAQSVRCSGLVPHTRYTLTRRRGHAVAEAVADRSGTISVLDLPGATRVGGGDLLTLANAAGRRLTTLHVAHLRVDITGNQTVLASGSCEPGDYYGQPLTTPPVGDAIGLPGVSGTGVICPVSGHVAGLSAAHVSQIDDLGGGETRTAVPMLLGSAPSQDAILYGPFRALAQTGLTGAHGAIFASRTPVALTIRSGRRVVFRSANVDTARGTAVRALGRGLYAATWVVRDANGDTRTVVTRFAES